VDRQAWLDVKAAALADCRAGRPKEAFGAMTASTGTEWCDPGEPGRIPPTPPVRDLDGFQSAMPRSLRRRFERARDSEDACGALEILSVLYDAYLELELTGVDEVEDYLYFHADVGYGASVYRFMVAAFDWHRGEASSKSVDWSLLLVVLALFASLIPESGRRTRLEAEARPPPRRIRPQVSQCAPPSIDGGYAVSAPA
jgi:hypothetical protein